MKLWRYYCEECECWWLVESSGLHTMYRCPHCGGWTITEVESVVAEIKEESP